MNLTPEKNDTHENPQGLPANEQQGLGSDTAVALNRTTEDFAQWMRDLGAFMYLLEHAQVQQRYPLGILRTRLFPALWHKQYRVYWQEGKPVAFLNWAWLKPELAERYRETQCHIEAEEWNAREADKPDNVSQLWFMEIIALEGHLPALIQDVGRLFPPGTIAHWHAVSAKGTPTKYQEFVFPENSVR